jgi:cytochrome c peroxidase
MRAKDVYQSVPLFQHRSLPLLPMFSYLSLNIRLLLCLFSICNAGVIQCSHIPHKDDHNSINTLGHYLFFDTRLSANGTKSCASCHDPSFAFTDGYRQSMGVYGDPLRRNAPSLLNARYLPSLNWADTHTKTFEAQMQGPLFSNNPPELGLSRNRHLAGRQEEHPYLAPKSIYKVLEELHADSLYQRLFFEAFPHQKNPYSSQNLFRAIAGYERTLVSFGSAYDRFLAGDTTALSAAAQRGLQLFFGDKGNCSRCHAVPLLSDGQMHQGDYTNGANSPTDLGLFEKTKNKADIGLFRTPSLRNVAITAPYFHDGSMATLSAVLTYFEKQGHSSQKPITLTNTERRDLILFLESLTDASVAQNPWFRPPVLVE